MHPRIRRPSPAMAVSLTALVVATGGTGYAAVRLPRNSVGAAQIRAGAVGSSELARNAVHSAQVANGSLRASDFRGGRLPAGPQGPQGPQGPRGDTGPAGAAGASGMSGLQEVFTIGTFDSNSPKTNTATCPTGKKVVGMGYNLNGVANNAVEQHLHAIYVLVTQGGTAVEVKATEDATGTTANWNIVTDALCASVSP